MTTKHPAGPAMTLGNMAWQILPRLAATREIAPAQPGPGDCNARRVAGSLPLRLGRRKFVHRGQAADTSLRPEMPIPAPSHQGRLIHKSWSRDCDCGRCFVYLPIAYFARWCGCPSKACFDQFSLPPFAPDYRLMNALASFNLGPPAPSLAAAPIVLR